MDVYSSDPVISNVLARYELLSLEVSCPSRIIITKGLKDWKGSSHVITDGDSLGFEVGSGVGSGGSWGVGLAVGLGVGSGVGLAVGCGVDCLVGLGVGTAVVGLAVMRTLKLIVSPKEGLAVRASNPEPRSGLVGNCVGDIVYSDSVG